MATAQELLSAMEALVAKAATLNGKRWRGDWDRAIAYSVNDMVIHKGHNYMSLTNLNRNRQPTQDPTSIYWAEMTPAIVAPTSAPGDTGTLTPGPLLVPKSTTNGYLDKGWLPPGLNPSVQYVAPGGDDTANGFEWHSAKRTSDAALTYLVSKGGGELHFATGVYGNIWLRGDGLSIPGWFPQMPLRIVGHGAKHSQFGPPVAELYGGQWENGGRLTPLIWLSKCTGAPIVIENLSPPNGVANQVFRAWDYRRYADGSIAFANVTSWVRAGGGADLTVELPTAIPATTAQRLSNVVTVHFASMAPAPAPVSVGQWIKFTDTSGQLTSGEFQVTAIDPSATNVTYFSFTSAGSDTGVLATPGSWQSHFIKVNDLIEFVQAVAPPGFTETPSCQYRVYAVTDATHFSVSDPYGYSPRSPSGTFSNPGQYVLQDRSNWYGSGLYELINCSGGSSVTQLDRFENGPTIDLGGTSDGRNRFVNCAFSGMAGNDIACHDPDRVAWMFVDGGGGSGCSSANVYFNRPNAGGIRMYGSGQGTWGFKGYDVQGDIGVGDVSPPALAIVRGNNAGFVYADQVLTADADDTVPNVTLENMSGADVRVSNCGLVEGRGYIDGGILANAWSVRTETPQTMRQHGFWQYGRIAGKISGIVKLLGGISTARVKSLASDPGSWTLNGSTMTTGQADPNGGTGAVKLTGVHNVQVASVTQAVAVGDKFLFGVHIKRTGGIAAGPNGVINLTASPAVSGWAAIANVEFKGDGEWQFIYCIADSAGSQASTTIKAEISVPSPDITVFEPTLLPLGNQTPNEWNYAIENFRSQPNYLPAGEDGTSVGRKFNADGGLVVGKSGYASGTVALFDGASAAVSAAGTGALRYNAGTNKIQYSKNGGAWTDLI